MLRLFIFALLLVLPNFESAHAYFVAPGAQCNGNPRQGEVINRDFIDSALLVVQQPFNADPQSSSIKLAAFSSSEPQMVRVILAYNQLIKFFGDLEKSTFIEDPHETNGVIEAARKDTSQLTFEGLDPGSGKLCEASINELSKLSTVRIDKNTNEMIGPVEVTRFDKTVYFNAAGLNADVQVTKSSQYRTGYEVGAEARAGYWPEYRTDASVKGGKGWQDTNHMSGLIVKIDGLQEANRLAELLKEYISACKALGK